MVVMAPPPQAARRRRRLRRQQRQRRRRRRHYSKQRWHRTIGASLGDRQRSRGYVSHRRQGRRSDDRERPGRRGRRRRKQRERRHGWDHKGNFWLRTGSDRYVECERRISSCCPANGPGGAGGSTTAGRDGISGAGGKLGNNGTAGTGGEITIEGNLNVMFDGAILADGGGVAGYTGTGGTGGNGKGTKAESVGGAGGSLGNNGRAGDGGTINLTSKQKNLTAQLISASGGTTSALEGTAGMAVLDKRAATAAASAVAPPAGPAARLRLPAVSTALRSTVMCEPPVRRAVTSRPQLATAAWHHQGSGRRHRVGSWQWRQGRHDHYRHCQDIDRYDRGHCCRWW